MDSYRIALVFGLPFILCIVVPAIIGAAIINSDHALADTMYMIMGTFMLFIFPVSIMAAWQMTKPKKNIITK